MEDQNYDINLQDVYNALGMLLGHVKSIKNWITFMGVLVLIGLLLSLFGGCMALF